MTLVEPNLLLLWHIAMLFQMTQRYLLCHDLVPSEIFDLPFHLTYDVILICLAQVMFLE